MLEYIFTEYCIVHISIIFLIINDLEKLKAEVQRLYELAFCHGMCFP